MRWFYTCSLLSLCVIIFALGTLVVEGDVRQFDQAGLAMVQSFHHPIFDGLALGLSFLGGTGAILVVGLAFLFLWRRKRLDGFVLLALMAGATILVIALKSFFQVTRPSPVVSMLPAANFSFPSGHALTAICLYGYLAWLAIENRAWVLALGLALLVPAIDWSRLYLRVHWPSDVLAGSLVGGTWLVLCMLGRRRGET